MMEFKDFKLAVQQQFQKMVEQGGKKLFLTDVSRDVLWETYLESFPEGTNCVYRERREYDCQHCRQFIRPFGNVVAVIGNELVSIWDVNVDDNTFQIVADALSKLVKSKPIADVFESTETKLGVDYNLEDTGGTPTRWEHFSFILPQSYVLRGSKSIAAVQGKYRSLKEVFKRGLDTITSDALTTAFELIEQKSLYRGEEFNALLTAFIAAKAVYEGVSKKYRDNHAWEKATQLSEAVLTIRNSAFGTFLVNLSEGMDLDTAVKAYEKIMAPANYKRPNAIFTKSMIEKAQAKIVEMGYEDSLGRRHAQKADITIDNVLFADRDAKQAMNVFDDLKGDVVSDKSFKKVEEMSIEDFVSKIVPKASTIEVMMENKHESSLVSLVAPEHIGSKSMLKWNNNFTWSYNGEVTDSIKEAVKSHGGNVSGDLRFSIRWAEDGGSDDSDLDAHCKGPERLHIFFSKKFNRTTGGNLDVDIRHPKAYEQGKVVENIVFPSKRKLINGKYEFYVNQYAKRGDNKGFTAEIETDGTIHEYSYNKPVRQGENISVAKVKVKDGVMSLSHNLESKPISKDIWGIKTGQFRKVSMMMFSPNHWDGQGVGNKHYFFMMEGCKNPNTPRGFYNEFLNQDLNEHRKVFEALGSKMSVKPSNEQLSGLGFSSTKRNSVIVKVAGTFNRTLKINF